LRYCLRWIANATTGSSATDSHQESYQQGQVTKYTWLAYAYAENDEKLEAEVSVQDFLGINITQVSEKSFHLRQTGLIKKILEKT
jgi:hypothetical protein